MLKLDDQAFSPCSDPAGAKVMIDLTLLRYRGRDTTGKTSRRVRFERAHSDLDFQERVDTDPELQEAGKDGLKLPLAVLLRVNQKNCTDYILSFSTTTEISHPVPFFTSRNGEMIKQTVLDTLSHTDKDRITSLCVRGDFRDQCEEIQTILHHRLSSGISGKEKGPGGLLQDYVVTTFADIGELARYSIHGELS